MMNIQIKNTNFNMTPDIKEYINSKISSVEKFLSIHDPNSEILVQAEIEQSTHHKKGNVFRVELNLSYDGNVYRSEVTSYDPRVSIDDAKDQLEKQIRRSKTKRGSLYEKGSRIIKKLLRRNND
jgi:ribosomal subunit interface protein